ncbi:uncharacterized protein LOC117170751 [Belonocnema kinseyi]|uniref:uncharacterized protein LOC117170751 n=1 Tax=Belonocnema kinseyi TaxID=2817044 RepID=UPI00143D3A9A|nr:uncharacterized protein LOC117170751 [Belonocnema kinseyi]
MISRFENDEAPHDNRSIIPKSSEGDIIEAADIEKNEPDKFTLINPPTEEIRPYVSTPLVGSFQMISEFHNDKGLYDDNNHINEDRKRALLLAGPCQPKESDMPGGEFKQSNDKRRFNSTFYYHDEKKPLISDNCSPWLSYFPTKHYAYCHFCWSFGDETAKKSAWCRGFTDWKHCHSSVKKHSLSRIHLQNAVAAASFLRRNDIRRGLDQQITEEANKWRTILEILFDTVKTLSGLGIAFRGHRENLQDENHGIYLSVIKLTSRHNPILRMHLESLDRIKYLSKTIKNELLSTLSDQTRNSIVDAVKRAKFFTLIADSTTDVAHIDQMAILLRYLDLQNETSKNSTKKYLLGQAYDGAPVMSGSRGGLQAKIKQFLGTEAFAPRWDQLLEMSQNSEREHFGIELLNELKNEMLESDIASEETSSLDKCSTEKSGERVLHVKGLSGTRWAARLKAVAAVIQNFDCILDCLEQEISRDTATGGDIITAQSSLSSLNWLFFLNLLWWHSALEIINSAQIQMQRKEIDLIIAQRCMSSALKKLQNLRKVNVYNDFVEKARCKWK